MEYSVVAKKDLQAGNYLEIPVRAELQPYSLARKSMKPVDYKNSPLSLIDLQIFNPPSLREVVNAYLESDEFRRSVYASSKTEITSTVKLHDHDDHTADGRKIMVVERVKNIFLDPRDELTWMFDYDSDKVSRLTEPPDGYVLEFDNVTGYPTKTGSRKEAMKIFGINIMRFHGGITDREGFKHGHDRIVKIVFPSYGLDDLNQCEPCSSMNDVPTIDAVDGYLEQTTRSNNVRRCKRPNEKITESQYRFLQQEKAMLEERQRKIEESMTGFLGE